MITLLIRISRRTVLHKEVLPEPVLGGGLDLRFLLLNGAWTLREIFQIRQVHLVDRTFLRAVEQRTIIVEGAVVCILLFDMISHEIV